MLQNYIKVALRNLWRNKAFSAINIFGLALGIACSLLIFLFIRDELSYDRFHNDANRVFRVVKDFVNDDGSRLPDATSPAALAPAMQKEMPEVVSVTRIRPNWGTKYLVKYGDQRFSEEKVYRVDSSFFDVFTFPFLQGNKATVFSDVNSVVITEGTAKKIFGKQDPMGKVLEIDGPFGSLTVTGVLKDIPANTHFHFDYLASYRKLPYSLDANWGGYNDYTYVKTKAGTDPGRLTDKIQELYKRNDKEDGSNIFYLQPLTDIHLHSNLKWELEPNSDQLYVYVFSLIGLFILVIAGINYINLSTAKASARAKEIGVRKVAGALRESLIRQFLVESVVTCMIAALIAVVMALVIAPFVNELTGKSLQVLDDVSLVVYLLSATIVLGLLAGFFPALYLSSFKPITVLKGFKLKEQGALSLRKALVVLQFTISIVLIIGALVIAQQMEYIQSARLGLNTDQVLVINKGRNISADKRDAFYNEVAALPGVKKVALASGMVASLNSTSKMRARGSANEQLVNFLVAGNNLFDVLGMTFREGRGFSEAFPSDTMTSGAVGPLDQTIGSIVINETAVRDLSIGFPAVGKQLLWGTDADTSYYLNIIGVVNDFHFTSMRNKIKPFAFINIPRQSRTFAVKLSGANITATIAQLEKKWNGIYPDKTFEYSFLDDSFASLYQAERRFQKVFTSLVVLGILIASLGLLGLATFAAQQRVKEIGIRKVLGASVLNITGLLSKDFLKLVMIAFIVASPIAWYAVYRWLQDFAYRTEIHWWIFPAAGILAILIALLTISFQAIKAAVVNPVKSLRTE
ncbi:FtsX-like permease family protein [Segetibacter sp. 3557_3]|uniref:ABC transporter permease n=1 Tax=Segetibacter sp. 3557_3 TaxID=2547429 RepID=UPI0010589D6F|nr:ABC transporter permease [Segetibacter sp. 3557_3]TDH21253.1 FtsX-like permease family protein [Segetibacter sp. 3557_3]